ncbi:hypothetical protein JX265_012005 [Neoarthrinium moseri]|uniref:Uncharacterized protein n=1 Tax=Neoarthrinium moseri TaxID=1658444 RepID=A0A9Q0AIX9_9PEZI|nr:hypothetical protein JX265_012005 [Neoarthrinium moseri]
MAVVVAIVYEARAIVIEKPLTWKGLILMIAEQFKLRTMLAEALEIRYSNSCRRTWMEPIPENPYPRYYPRCLDEDAYRRVVSDGGIFWIGNFGKGEINTVEITDKPPIFLRTSIKDAAGDLFHTTNRLEKSYADLDSDYESD